VPQALEEGQAEDQEVDQVEVRKEADQEEGHPEVHHHQIGGCRFLEVGPSEALLRPSSEEVPSAAEPVATFPNSKLEILRRGRRSEVWELPRRRVRPSDLLRLLLRLRLPTANS